MDSTNILDLVAEAQSDKEDVVNALIEAGSNALLLGKRDSTTSGLTWGYYGGRIDGTSIASGTLTLTDNATNYIVVNRATLVVSVSTATTHWNDATNYARAYSVVVASGVPTWSDCRLGSTGVLGGGTASSSGSTTFTGDVTNNNGSPPDPNALLITDGAVTTSKLAALAVTTAKITDANVTTAKIADANVTNAKLANMAAHTFKGNNTSGSAAPVDMTATQATAELNAVVGDSGSGGTKGLVPAPGSGDAAAGKFLKADGTFAIPPGTGGTPGGSTTQVQYNSSSAFAGDSGMTYDSTNHQLTAVFCLHPTNGINVQTGTSYTLLASDNGKLITLNNASAITLHVSGNLGAGFSCMIRQLGAGQVTPVPDTGVNVFAYNSATKTAGQYADAMLIAHSADNFVFSGAIA